jgi:hypothetical protein
MPSGEGEVSNETIAKVGGHAFAAVKEMLKAQGKDPRSGFLIVGMPEELFRVTVEENEIGNFNVANVQPYEA